MVVYPAQDERMMSGHPAYDKQLYIGKYKYILMLYGNEMIHVSTHNFVGLGR